MVTVLTIIRFDSIHAAIYVIWLQRVHHNYGKVYVEWVDLQARCTRTGSLAGPKIALHFPCLFVYPSVHLQLSHVQ